MKTGFRPAFTLLELIMVMVITIIIVGSTFQLLLNIYRSYSYIHDMNSLDLKLSNASIQIVKYLENRVIGTVIDSNDTNFQVLSGRYIIDRNQTIQWIGKAFDTFNGTWDNNQNRVVSNWSSLIDLSKDHNETIIYLDERNLSQAEDIIFLLSKGEVNISQVSTINNSHPAIFFNLNGSDTGFGWKESILGDSKSSEQAFIGYFKKNVGLKDIFKSRDSSFSDKVLVEKEFKKTLKERYSFSWSAYGVKIEQDRSLSLYYNYRPWNGENMEKNGTKIKILENVTEFKYSSTGALINFRICIEDSTDSEITFCRESIVY